MQKLTHTYLFRRRKSCGGLHHPFFVGETGFVYVALYREVFDFVVEEAVVVI